MKQSSIIVVRRLQHQLAPQSFAQWVGLRQDFELRDDLDVTTEVEASVDRISKMNVSGTPMFFVARTSGDKVTIAKVVEGAQPFEAFKTAVDEVEKGK